MTITNWATNIAFQDKQTLHPRSLEELREIVLTSPKVRVRGSGHCFNTIADASETAVILDRMPQILGIDEATQTARVGAGLNYAQISEFLHSHGWAIHNLASLPHISIAGAVATGTHGSGVKNGPLHTAVRAIEIMGADGEVRTLRRDIDALFYGSVVSLGAIGIAISFELDIEPTFDIFQTVYGDMPRTTFGNHIIEALSYAYSVSYFTTWSDNGVGDLWVKSKTSNPETMFAVKARTEKAHPIFGVDPNACTEQLNIPGSWHLRLPHFRIDATPSAGNELQSEFFVDSKDAAMAFQAIEAIAPQLRHKLLVTEIRSMAADQHWMSQSYERESVAFHCTWQNDPEVPSLVALIEEALKPFAFRVHVGKVFNVGADHFRANYPKFDDFIDYVKSVDHTGKFQNDFTSSLFSLNLPHS